MSLPMSFFHAGGSLIVVLLLGIMKRLCSFREVVQCVLCAVILVEADAPGIRQRDVEHPERIAVCILLRLHAHTVGNIEIGAQVEYCERIYEESVVGICLYAVAVHSHGTVVTCYRQGIACAVAGQVASCTGGKENEHVVYYEPDRQAGVCPFHCFVAYVYVCQRTEQRQQSGHLPVAQ